MTTVINNSELAFARDWLKTHHYVSAKVLAREYNNCKGHEKPSRSSACIFGQILKKFREKGIIKKWSSFQYKKI